MDELGEGHVWEGERKERREGEREGLGKVR